MSNLQIGLAVAGGLVLVGVVAHGAWSSRRSAPRQPLPGLSPQAPQDPVLQEDALNPAPVLSQLVPAARKPALDPLIDVIANLSLDPGVASLAGEAALAAMPATRRVGTKPFAVEGLNVLTSAWEPPATGQRYSAFQAGVQLANRSGALNEIEFSEFVVKTQAYADALGASAEFPEMLDEVARARELDQFASAHDAQLGLMVRAQHASWSPGYIQQNAARLGFVAGAMAGRMVLPSFTAGQPAVLVLSFDPQAALSDDPAQSAIRELNLHLDVAQVDRAENAFERMHQAAFTLAQDMDGVVTDDAGQPLSPPAMAPIAAELEALYATLEQRDLAAGSPLARRLFS